jgi:hypothetical protein
MIKVLVLVSWSFRIMNEYEETELQLQHGFFFSPGFYMRYWDAQILPNFSAREVAFGNKLKMHREVWIGAHLAALKTALSGEKFMVGVPETDPPDVLVGNFHKVTTASGKTGQNLNWFPVENTRCDISVGETLFEQITKKNTVAYKDTVLAVYLQGAEIVPNMKELSDSLIALSTFYPHEVIVMVQLQDGANPGVPDNSFGFVQVYPAYDTIIINRGDVAAYYMEPNIMKQTGRGIASEPTNLGTIRLMPPSR